MRQCGAFLQFLVDMVHFGRGGGAPPWTPSPPPPSAQATPSPPPPPLCLRPAQRYKPHFLKIGRCEPEPHVASSCGCSGPTHWLWGLCCLSCPHLLRGRRGHGTGQRRTSLPPPEEPTPTPVLEPQVPPISLNRSPKSVVFWLQVPKETHLLPPFRRFEQQTPQIGFFFAPF